MPTPTSSAENPLEAKWPDGMTWLIGREVVGACDDKQSSLLISGPFEKTGDDEFQYKLSWVRKTIKDAAGNPIGTREWLVIWKFKPGKLQQEIQLANFKEREAALTFMKDLFCKYLSAEITKEAAEDQKKAWLEVNGVWKKKGKPAGALKRPAAAGPVAEKARLCGQSAGPHHHFRRSWIL